VSLSKTKRLLTDEWSRAALSTMEERSDDQQLIPFPSIGTASSGEFFRTLNHTLGVLFQLVNVSIFSDNAALVAKKLLDGHEDIPKGFNPFEPIDSTRGPFQSQLIKFSGDITEMVMARLSDNFTTYTSDIIRECLKAKPDALRSKESITVEQVLSFESIEELQEFVVDRKVNELSYLGFSKLAEWISNRFGISDLQKLPSHQAIALLIEIRNCVVHNRGCASRKYIENSAHTEKIKLGEKLCITMDDITLAALATSEVVTYLDEELSVKFSLKREKFVG